MTETTLRTKFSYDDYMKLMEKLVAEGKTTGANQSEDFAHYTKMNNARMKRLNKTASLLPELSSEIEKLDRDYTFLVLTEAWCGDAAQNLPIFAKMAEASPHLKLELVLRDENLDLMDQHLTNGGRSIPKLLMIDDLTGNVVTTWGPRPVPMQQMVMDRKHTDPEKRQPYSEFNLVVQKWYNQDKTVTAQNELKDMLSELKS